MTQDDAMRIKQAALVMLHAIETDLGDNNLMAALRYLPVDAEYRESITLRTAYELLEATPAWKDAAKDEA
jgi:hypothetical protein